MQNRPLGSSAATVSEIGLGCWQFGGDFGAMEDDRALAVLRAASDAGGRRESPIGRYFGESSTKPMVAKKFCRPLSRQLWS